MRWYWIDRLVEFESGRRAKAVKLVTLAEDYLHSHFPGYPVMPNSLVLEGMGQTAMLLACEAIGYAQLILLAKVPSARFFFDAVPGDALTYTVHLISLNDAGISATGTSHRGDRLQGEAELLFARVADSRTIRQGPGVVRLVEMMHVLGAFSIGRAADGSRLTPPARLGK
jgi:3-hydroxyacyl-[acyl-carrier-protein] dehydratase